MLALEWFLRLTIARIVRRVKKTAGGIPMSVLNSQSQNFVLMWEQSSKQNRADRVLMEFGVDNVPRKMTEVSLDPGTYGLS